MEDEELQEMENELALKFTELREYTQILQDNKTQITTRRKADHCLKEIDKQVPPFNDMTETTDQSDRSQNKRYSHFRANKILASSAEA